MWKLSKNKNYVVSGAIRPLQCARRYLVSHASLSISRLELKLYRLGLPKKGETFFFFKINDWSIHNFCKQLGDLLPRITTAIEVQDDQARIAKEQKRARLEGTDSQILDMTGVNIAFSQRGLLQVSDTII